MPRKDIEASYHSINPMEVDVDIVFTRAMAAGATDPVQPEDHAWGDRVAGFTDPFENRWWIATSQSWG